MMIRSRLPQVKLAREQALGHRITYNMIKAGAGISQNTIARLKRPGAAVERIDGKTLCGLCKYFDCQVGDLLEYVPSDKAG